MANLVIYFDHRNLPNKESWERVASDYSVPLGFEENFNPVKFPQIEEELNNQSTEIISVYIGEAKCDFELSIFQHDPEKFVVDIDKEATKDCDRAAGFSWSEFDFSASLAAQLAAATLAIATVGLVSWQCAKGGWCKGEKAFSIITKKPYNDIKKLVGSSFNKLNPFGPVIDVIPLASGAIKCPRCNKTFKPTNSRSWDGEKHLSCGQMLNICEN